MKTRIVAVLLSAGVAAAAFTIYFFQVRQQASESALPAEAPPAAIVDRIDFSLPDLDGNMRALSEWDGKARIVNFWATWCAPCRREIPLLKSAQLQHADDNLQVIGIAVDFEEPVRDYAEEADFNYPVLIGQEDAMAAVEVSGLEFVGLPVTMIVAPGGQLLKTHIGEIVESHIELIVGVFSRLEAGDIDLAAARAELNDM